MTASPGLGWLGIARLGLVQSSLGAIVVLSTSTLNRVMAVELALPAMLPGALVGLHYAVQIMRPRLGYGSDVGGRRTPWIVGGMAVLAAGSTLAAVATALMATSLLPGLALAVAAFLLIGLGVGAAGTNLLVLLATSVQPRLRPAAATTVWMMMIAGFVVTAGTAGHLLDPYSPARLVAVAAGVSGLAFVLASLAVWRVERPAPASPASAAGPPVPFRQALAEVWAEPQSRRFAVFVFVSMLAYSAQDLVLEPFAGNVFGFTPGESTKLSGVQHGGLLGGMILVAVAGTLFSGSALGAMRTWTVGGCLASALTLGLLGLAALHGGDWPLRATVFAGGVANGAFAIAAIAAMMQLVGAGRGAREGVRMGLWGSAQAIAFGFGGFGGTAVADLGRYVAGSAQAGYAAVFLGEALMFLASAVLAVRVFGDVRETAAGEGGGGAGFAATAASGARG